jgi:hypothetical protein
MTGSYFLSLELENVRCFSERQRLDLSDGNGRPARWTILLGENGTGKTTILQLLAAVEPIVFEPLNPNLPNRAPRYVLMQAGGPFFRRFNIEAVAVVRFAERSGLFRGTQGSTHEITVREYEGAKRADGQYNATLPSWYGYGAGRRLSGWTFDRTGGRDESRGLFSDDTELIHAENWLLQLDYSASKPSEVQVGQKRRLDMVKDVLIKVLPDVTEIRFDPSSGVRPTPTVEFKTPYGWVPLRQLGYGYRTMIAWVVDLAARMIDRYPDSQDPLAEPAVVLVDELDLHLHPKWQREVIGFLTERFPNTQFIVTAHSPLIVQAAADANIVVLRREGDHVVIKNDPETLRGWRVDQVLTSELFGLETARPPDMEELLRRRRAILTKPRLTKADQEVLEKINDQIGPIAPGESFDEAKKTMDLIERSTELVKKYQGTKT